MQIVYSLACNNLHIIHNSDLSSTKQSLKFKNNLITFLLQPNKYQKLMFFFNSQISTIFHYHFSYNNKNQISEYPQKLAIPENSRLNSLDQVFISFVHEITLLAWTKTKKLFDAWSGKGRAKHIRN